MSQICARKVGSTAPIGTTFQRTGGVLDLTGATTVTLHIGKGAGLTATAVVDADPSSGTVVAPVPVGATDDVGAYPLDWHITWADGTVTKIPDPGCDTLLVDAD
jgi:hypothetical protein